MTPLSLCRKLSYSSLAVTVSLALATAAFAQIDTGSIPGTIKDTSGTVVPGARVTLTNDGTAQAITTTSRSSGDFTFSPVKIGRYSVSAEFKGFQRVEHTQVTVEV